MGLRILAVQSGAQQSQIDATMATTANAYSTHDMSSAVCRSVARSHRSQVSTFSLTHSHATCAVSGER